MSWKDKARQIVNSIPWKFRQNDIVAALLACHQKYRQGDPEASSFELGIEERLLLMVYYSHDDLFSDFCREYSYWFPEAGLPTDPEGVRSKIRQLVDSSYHQS